MLHFHHVIQRREIEEAVAECQLAVSSLGVSGRRRGKCLKRVVASVALGQAPATAFPIVGLLVFAYIVRVAGSVTTATCHLRCKSEKECLLKEAGHRTSIQRLVQ